MKKTERVTWSETERRLIGWLHGCDLREVPKIADRDWRRLVHLMQRLQREAGQVSRKDSGGT